MIPFVGGVRSEDKKAVIECVHQDFVEQISSSEIQQQQSTVDTALLKHYLPDVDLDDNKSLTDSGYIPVTHKEFNRMLGYGKPRYQAAVIVSDAGMN